MGSDADAVVAAEGSGNITTIGTAVDAAPRKSTNRHVIHIKAGFYTEYVTVGEDLWNLTLAGDGMDKTTISGNRSHLGDYKTHLIGTVSVYGPGFVAHDLTFENTAGAANHQAAALRTSSDNSAVYRCAMKGYQDTLYAKEGKQFYGDCRIYGTVDFIFGDATAVFQRCTVVARKPLQGQPNTITAQGRTDGSETTGFSFQSCEVVADDELAKAGFPVKTYLGRSWELCSRVVFMECNLGSLVDGEGWLQWEKRTVAPPF